jgi:O-antigen/teichoic acid export membrane protein
MLRGHTQRTLITGVGVVGLGVVNSIFLSRWLGPEDRGELAAAMLWPPLLVYIGSLGMMPSIVFHSARPNANTGGILANSLLLGSVQSAVAVAIGFFALPALLASQQPGVVTVSKLYLLVIPVALATQYGLSVLQGRMHITALNWLRLLIPAGYLAGVLVLFAAGALTLSSIVALHLVLNAVLLAATAATLVAVGLRPAGGVDVGLTRGLLAYGAKVQVGELSQGMALRLDQILMAAWLPAADLGLYVVAVSAAGISQVLSNAVRTVATPSIAGRDCQKEQGDELARIFRSYWVVSLAVMIAIAPLLPLAIPALFGEAFRGAIWPAELLLLGAFLIGAKDVLTGGAQALGNAWLGSRADLLAMGVTLALLPILLPRMGILGAALTSVVAYAVELCVVVLGLSRTHAISPGSLFSIRASDVRLMLRSQPQGGLP